MHDCNHESDIYNSPQSKQDYPKRADFNMQADLVTKDPVHM